MKLAGLNNTDNEEINLFDKINRKNTKRAKSDKESVNNLKSITVPYNKNKSDNKPTVASETVKINRMMDQRDRKHKRNYLINSIISCTIMISSSYEVYHNIQNNFDLTWNLNTMRLIICLLAILQLLLVFHSYLNIIEFRRREYLPLIYQERSVLFDFFVEIFICCMVIPPYLNSTFTFNQIAVTQTLGIDGIILILVFLRVYYLFRTCIQYSELSSINKNFYFSIQLLNDLVSFVMKGILKAMPWLSILGFFGLTTLLIGILLVVYENAPESSLNDLFNALWFISYTQSTVGYGDMGTKTHLGRVAVCSTIFIGVFLYSYMVLIVKNTMQFNKEEEILYSRIKSIQRGKLSEIKAIILMQRWWRLIMKRRLGRSTLKDLLKFNFQLRSFTLNRLIISQEMTTKLQDYIEKADKSCTKQFNKLMGHIDQITPIESLSIKLSNINYFLLKKIKSCKRGFQKHFDKKNFTVRPRGLAKSQINSASSASSRASMHKLRSTAVKKLIETKIKRNSIVPMSQIPLHTEENFLQEIQGQDIYIK